MSGFLGFALVFFGFVSQADGQNGQAPNQVVNKVLSRESNGGAKAYLTFASETGLIGHAFITLSFDDPQSRACKVDAALGLYPNQEKKNRLLALQEKVPGGLLSDLTKNGSLPSNATTRLIVPLTNEEFEIIKLKVGAFADRDYALMDQDCITFCEEVAQTLGLKVPDRKMLFEKWRKALRREIGKDAESRTKDFEAFPVYFIRMLDELNSPTRNN